LGLLKGKGLFFVNSTESAYRLKLFLEQFHIRTIVLNAELPLASRLSILDQFNVGNFDYLIATDEANTNTASNDQGGKKSRRKRKKDAEYGVSRGVDFQGVSFVVNYDFPISSDSYTHRVGRTARGDAKGVALSFVQSEAEEQHHILQLVQASQPPLPVTQGSHDTNLIADTSAEESFVAQPTLLDFNLKDIEGFRYRVEDVGRAVTSINVREARAAEVKAEVLNSEKLQSHFSDNPHDLHLLRHDRQTTHATKMQDHLK
jgi:ATP-dependent RNA helicase DDX56/DBP9